MERSRKITPPSNPSIRFATRATPLWIGAIALTLVLGCEAKSTRSASSEDAASPGTNGASATTDATPAAVTTQRGETVAGTTGRIYRIVLSDGMDGGHYCVRISQPRQPVRLGDAVRWVSKASRKIMIDINGTSPMARGHFELEPRGADGDVITYHGDKVFYYSVLPNECTGDKPSPEIVVSMGAR